MATVTFSGISSGIDTASLVTQLVAAARIPANAIASRQQDLNTQKSIVGSMTSALSALGTAARGMDLASELQPRTAVSSDSKVTIAASSGAAATVHDVRVQRLARGQITASKTFGSAGAGAAGNGTLGITSNGTTKSISYTSADSLADIAARINGAGAGVSASVLFDGAMHRLMVAANETGTAAAPTFTDGGSGLGLSDPDNITVQARDSLTTINGVDVTRGSNVISDAIAGVTLTLVSPHAVADPSTTLRISQDTNGLRDKLKSLVSAYNAVNGALHVQLDYNGTKKGTDTLFGDPTLRQLQGALAGAMSNGYGASNASTLGAVGLTRGKGGELTLDEAKLNAALAKDPEAVSNLFVRDGFANALTKLTDAYTRAGDGLLAAKSKSLSERYTVLGKQAEQINAHADSLKTRLEAQFGALESAMTRLKSQSAFLSSALG